MTAQMLPGAGDLYAGNGTPGATLPRRRPIPIPTPAQITTLVDSHERYTEALRTRMESDWAMMILTPFDPGDGYQEYTSNEPMTFYAKMTSSLSSGKIKLEIPAARAKRAKREREAMKERFLIGILKANDERLLSLGEPRLQDSLGAFINLRGWYCGRSMLVKDIETEETYADITPWDPLHVSWGIGPKGLKWVCHHTKKTLAEVREEYGFTPGQAGAGYSMPESAESYFDAKADGDNGVDVYDWYDEENNIVVIGGEYAKPPTRHTPLRRVPAFFGSVGPLPLIQSRSGTSQDNLRFQGESIFAANRGIYDKVNLVLSTMLQLVALSRDQAIIIYSRDGTKTLKNNPFLTGAQTPLVTGEDKLDIMPLLEMSKDTGAFLGLVSAEVQRGALPYSVYGQLAFQLSGYAVNLLKQATDSPIVPRKQAMENAYSQIAGLIGDQFATGAYGAMQLNGYGRNREWFDEEFTPDMMQGLPSAEVTLTVHTPQDDMQKIQMAKLLDEGPWPLLDRRNILDSVLGYQDTDSIDDAIKEQQGERMLPVASLLTVMQALEKQGRSDLAALYFAELVKLGIMGLPGQGVEGQNGQGQAGGFSPENLSAPEQGAPVPQPNPQQGPNVPAGSPRPGAQRAMPPVVAAWGQ